MTTLEKTMDLINNVGKTTVKTTPTLEKQWEKILLIFKIYKLLIESRRLLSTY
jgi:hypothetical protein